MYSEGDNSDEFLPVRAVIPDAKYNAIFLPRFLRFNAMQSVIAAQAVNTNDNMVVAAPTGSGKTVIHELAIIRFIMTLSDREQRKKSKILFMAPNKALCHARMKDWQKFSTYNIKIVEMTGDSSPTESLKDLTNAHIIITTPEKWDSLTRLWRQHVFLLGSISLLLLDEVHSVGESRGACLEAIVVRTKLVTQLYQERLSKEDDQKKVVEVLPMRIVALSATLPNVGDVGEWLECPPQGIHYFDDTYRPVPLEIHSESFGNIGSNEFLFDKKLDERVPDVVKKYSDGRQTIVFCHTVAQTVNLTPLLIERLGTQEQNQKEASAESVRMCRNISDAKLRMHCKQGVAYHNSLVSPEDRDIVEKLFMSGHLRILASTSTLSHGMNLPAYCVVIRGTRAWRGSNEGYCDVGRSDVIQMLGRAGRPNFDVKGVGVIMTDSSSIESFTKHNSDSLGANVVESQLLSLITETMCCEIAQVVITSLETALAWIRRSFFYVRVGRNPTHYNFEAGTTSLDAQLRKLCIITLERLSNEGIISFDSESEIVTARPEATVMSRHMVSFPTMIILLALPPNCGIKPLLQQLSACTEIQRPLRKDEKKNLNEYSKSMRYPMTSSERVKTPRDRCFVLLQMAVDGIEASPQTLAADIPLTSESVYRILTALISLSLERGHGMLLESAMKLRRSLVARVWDGGHSSLFLQISGLSSSLKQRLRNRSAPAALLKLGDVRGKHLDHIMRDFQCSHQDATRVQEFVDLCARTAIKIAMNVSETSGGWEMVVNVSPVYPEEAAKSTAASSASLICYNAITGALLCHHVIDRGLTSFRIAVPLPPDVSTTDVYCTVITDCVGLDATYDASLGTKPQPKNMKKSATASTHFNAPSMASLSAPSRVTPTKHVRSEPKAVLSQSRENSMHSKAEEASVFDRFAFAEEPLSANSKSPFVPVEAYHQPTAPRASDVNMSAFMNSPVYQQFSPAAAAGNSRIPLRGSDLLNHKRHELQLSSGGSVKRIRSGPSAASAAQAPMMLERHGNTSLSDGMDRSQPPGRIPVVEDLEQYPSAGRVSKFFEDASEGFVDTGAAFQPETSALQGDNWSRPQEQFKANLDPAAQRDPANGTLPAWSHAVAGGSTDGPSHNISAFDSEFF